MKSKLLLSVLLVSVFLLLGFFEQAQSQDENQRQWLRNFAQEQTDRWQRQKAEAEIRAEQMGIPIRREFEDGRTLELQRFEDGIPVYYQTHNLGGAITSSVDAIWPGGDIGIDLTGNNHTLGIWDGGAVRASHQEFGDRVTQQDDSDLLSNHATHVAGTMIAGGIDSQARGMAYEANLDAYDWNDDLADATNAALDGLLVSNHSYGLLMGWNYDSDQEIWQWYGKPDISETEDYRYGLYSGVAEEWDELAYNAPNYQIVSAAGNSRLEGPEEQPVEHLIWDGETNEWVFSEQERDLDGGPLGYGSIGGRAVAKNVLAVGAVSEIDGGYENPGDVVMSSFSSWGPTDDGRVKPEIVANGVGVYSPLATGDDQYAGFSGTSMASPMVSGVIGLLQELYEDVHGEPALSSTMRGLLVHTANQAGFDEGPDYRFGYGLMNAERAVETLQGGATGNGGEVVEEISLNEGEEYQYTMAIEGEAPLKATIAWTDPAADALTPQLNPQDIVLVNDLDLRIEGPNGGEYEPFVLDPNDPESPAGTGDNVTDNIEQVFIEDPVEGEYVVSITHKGNLEGGSQQVSLLISDEAQEPFENPFAGGFGTQTNPYQIQNAEQLDEVRNYLGNHFILTDNIDASGIAVFEPIGELAFTDDGIIIIQDNFQGSFDGNGYTISGLNIENPVDGATGMFAILGGGAVITEVTLTEVTVTGEDDRTAGLVGASLGQVLNSSVSGEINSNNDLTGGLVAQNQGLIYNSSVEADVTGGHLSGGLVGWNIGLGVIAESEVSGNVSGGHQIGGLAGVNEESLIEASESSANVNGDQWVGGLTGDSYFGLVETSKATGNVTGNAQAGGLIGSSLGHVMDSYATGEVEASDQLAGGLIGFVYGEDQIARQQTQSSGDYTPQKLDDAEVDRRSWEIEEYQTIDDLPEGNLVRHSYATGVVSAGEYNGGFAGAIGDDEAEIAENYWDTQASGVTDGIGDGSSSQIFGLQTDEMTGMEAFGNMAGFLFADTWQLTEGYPALYWEEVDAIEPPSRDITFRVDMSVQQEMDLFRPEERGDEVEVLGTFNGWDSGDTFMILEDNVYTITINVPGFEEDDIEYKFRINTGDDRDLPHNGFEQIGDDPLQNREYTLGEVDQPEELEVVYFSNMEEPEPLFAGGEGTKEAPYQVAAVEHLNYVRYFPEAHFIQTEDIDAGAHDHFEPISDLASPFFGEFDGNDFEIANLTIETNDVEDLGLFGVLAPGSRIVNISLIDITVQSNTNWAGGIAGFSLGEVSEVFVSGTITGDNDIGGVVGQNAGVITNAETDVVVEGVSFLGGISGSNVEGASILNAFASGELNVEDYASGGVTGFNNSGIEDASATVDITGGWETGGLVGVNDQGFIRNSFANADIQGGSYVGGLAGVHVSGIIEQSYSGGTVTGNNSVGGLAGIAVGAEVSNTHSYADVTGEGSVGGLLGEYTTISDSRDSRTTKRKSNDEDVTLHPLLEVDSMATEKHTRSYIVEESQVAYSYASGSVTSDGTAGGLIGENHSDAEITASYWSTTFSGVADGVGAGGAEGVSGLTLTEMRQEQHFDGWDFEQIWAIEESVSFPYLPEISEPVMPPQAYVQFIHSSADPAIDELEFIIGEDYVQRDLNFRNATEFTNPPADLTLGVTVRTTDEEPDTLWYDPEVAFDNNAAYQIIATGVEGSDFADNPEGSDTSFDVWIVEEIATESASGSGVDLKMIHVATDSPEFNLVTGEEVSFLDEWAYSGASDYIEVDPGVITFEAESTADGTHYGTFELDLEAYEGEAVSVLANGFVDSDANQQGEELKLLAFAADGSVSEAEIITSARGMADLPDEVQLHQNYPNPFNPATTISYDIPDQQQVRLEVYNILGELVEVLVDETKEPGSYEVNWNASSVASGVYMYRLRAGDRSITKQMTFVK